MASSPSAPVSSFFSSPVITIYLTKNPSSSSNETAQAEPNSSAPNSSDPAPASVEKPKKSNKRKRSGQNAQPRRSSRSSVKATAPTSTPKEAPVPSDPLPTTFQVHVSALTAHSLYFKSLISFNGIEVSQNRVEFESPTVDSDEEIEKIAFSCFMDFIYTGTYNLLSYHRGADQHKIVSMMEQLPFHAAVYVLGERLLSEGLKKEALKKLYVLLFGYHAQKHGKQPRIPNETFPSSFALEWPESFHAAVRIAFDGTLEKSALPVQTPPEIETPPKGDRDLFWGSKGRLDWLGGEPIRNLLAAFFASIWHSISHENIYARFVERGMRERRRLVEERPELVQLMLVYLACPSKLERFWNFPLSDFGFGEEDNAALGVAVGGSAGPWASGKTPGLSSQKGAGHGRVEGGS